MVTTTASPIRPPHGVVHDVLPGAQQAYVSPFTALTVIRGRKVSIVLVGLALSAVAVAGVSQLTHSYIATASVLIQDRKSAVTEIQTAGTFSSDSVAVRTQADILHSTGLAEEVVKTLKLAERPEFAVEAKPSLPQRVLANGVVQGALTYAERFDTSGWLRENFKATPPKSLTTQERQSVTTALLLGMTSIVNDGRSYVVDIKMKVSEGSSLTGEQAARLSAELANAYAETYTRFTSRIKSDTIRRANGFFDERIAALQEKVRQAESAVQRYRRDNALTEDRAVSSEGRSVSLASQQLAQLNSDLVTATAERANKQATLDQIIRARSDGSVLEALPEVLASPLIQQLRAQQAELGAKEAALAVSRGVRSPDLVAIHGSQHDVAVQISAEVAKIAASLRTSVDAAKAKESAIRTRLAQLQSQVGVEGEAEIKLRELQNEADIARAIYTLYLKRSQETSEQLDVQEPDALVVSRAAVPLTAAPPSKKQLAVLGIGVAWVVSVLLAFVRERMRPGFRTAEQLESAVGIATLGFIPRVRNPAKAMRFGDRASVFSEAIVSVRSLLRLSLSAGSKVVMVTSALPQEGKTFFCSALARNAALAGERVLLVDCDLRRPNVAKTVGFNHTDTFDGVTVRSDASSPLQILSFELDSQSSADLFASSKMRDLLAILRGQYSLILLDTPPVLAVSDARILSAMSDATVLVVKWQQTPQKLVNQAIAQLRSSGARIAGSVIQQVKLSSLTQADGAHGYVYQSSSRYLPGRA